MTAVLGGVGAALCWAVSVLSAARAARLIGAANTLAWVMAMGLTVSVVLLAIFGLGRAPSGETVAWLTIAGLTNVAGLRLEYAAMAVGQVGVVTQISSTEGMIAALLAVIGGEQLGGTEAACCVAIVVGVLLSTQRPRSDGGEGSRWVALAVGGALLFGVDLYALGRAGAASSILLVLIPARLVGTVFVAAPRAATRSLDLTAAAAPLVALTAVCEVGGVLSYTAGARASIAVAAVITSQFSALAAIGAYLLYRERLVPLQIAGLATAAAGVTVLAALGG